MRHETCYGVIPLRDQNGGWELLLLKHSKGLYWGFPKGHANPGEEGHEAAQRELLEETCLKVVEFLALPEIHEEYTFDRNGEQIHKNVYYFAAVVEGDPRIQAGEILDHRWVSTREAASLITFPQSRAVLESFLHYLS